MSLEAARRLRRVAGKLHTAETLPHDAYEELQNVFKDHNYNFGLLPYVEACKRVWETYGPPEWQGGDCPHYMLPRTNLEPIRFPYGMTPPQLRWALNNVPTLKTSLALLNASVVLQNRLATTFGNEIEDDERAEPIQECVWGAYPKTRFQVGMPVLAWAQRAFYIDSADDAILNESSSLRSINRQLRELGSDIPPPFAISAACRKLSEDMAKILEEPDLRDEGYARVLDAFAGSDSEGNSLYDSGTERAFRLAYPLLDAILRSNKEAPNPLAPLVALEKQSGVVCTGINGNSASLYFPQDGLS